MHNTMDSRVGLDFIVENPEYMGKLAAAMDTSNTQVKKQVIELLSALCVYNEDGYARTTETLERYRKLKGERYRLSLIVNELDKATSVDYQTAVMAFVNCLIISTPRLLDRARLRNEFIGVQLIPILNRLRMSAENEPELAVQLDVFDEQRESDDAATMRGPHGLDLSSHLDVFYAILRQVADTPQEIPFLSILQHLLRIDPKEAMSDIVWDTAERLVHRATLLEDREDAARLLRSPSTTKFASHGCVHCQQHRGSTDAGSGRKPSLTAASLSPTPPPPPPMAKLTSQPPPPPPPPPSSAANVPVPPPPMSKPMPLRTTPTSPSSNENQSDTVAEKLPQQETPTPKIKMKTINWNKIPNNKVVGKNNIWSLVADSHQHSPMTDMDWSEMEGLFCQQIPPANSAQSSPRLGRDTPTQTPRVRKDTSEVALLDGKRSLNVNIFLKQFRSSNEDIVHLIREGEHDEVGSEKLRGLLKILPEVDELDMLKSYTGDFDKLGNAEKFLIQLTNLSNYKLRIESMLLKEEFATNMGYLEPSINSMMVAAEELMTNKALQEVLYMVVVSGNFLNSGGYAGNAAGVKLSSLQKITDIRANKPNMNLIHYVAQQAEKRNRNLLSFPDSLTMLEDAAKTTVEQLQNEIKALDTRIKKIKKIIELPTTEEEIKTQMTEFLMTAEREVDGLQRDMHELENVRKRLADFFCEDINTFKIEECFRVFHGFCSKFRQSVVENARRRLQEEQANQRRKQREELLAARRRQINGLAGTPVSDPEGTFPEITFLDKKKKTNGTGTTSEDEVSLIGSPCVGRRRIGSFTGDGGNAERSPDITPNGSLRRRRSRVLSEEDEGNLMEFLRVSGHNDANRERKSWGSLDRSWARRARGGTPRKRPALLVADFGNDRERPNSPSPLAEKKPIVEEPTTEEPAKPKEWRQKIESWLRDNEGGSDPTTARRNRRSFETDSEGERTLDTLHEGKLVHSGNQTYMRVSPDWKPSIERTDVVGAIEAIEDARQQQPQIKDKSAWRKSTLNVPNSTEETKRQEVPRRTMTTTTTTKTDEDRKGLISSLGDRSASDRLTLYMRRTDKDSPVSNKIEIDSDNIETPPATRKIFTPSPVDKREPTPPTQCKRMLARPVRETLPSPEDVEPPTVLGDGQFDRFSSARRTRRYKRNPDSQEIVAETQVIRPSQLQIQNSCPVAQTVPDKESRLKQWQDKLKSGDPISANKSRVRSRTTVIDRDDVKAAFKLATSKNGNSVKTKEHDNDEGFEETQSLMSESPSQGTSSNDLEGDYGKNRPVRTSSLESKCTVDSSGSETTARKKVLPPPPPTPHERALTLMQRYNNRAAERSGSVSVKSDERRSVIPRRALSLRKGENANKITPERSNSRTSLVSSRSSLNSAASTNTVKRMPTKPSPIQKSAVPKTAVVKKHPPVVVQQPKRAPPAKPPLRPTAAPTFMKPTTASATKTTSIATARLQAPSYRSASIR